VITRPVVGLPRAIRRVRERGFRAIRRIQEDNQQLELAGRRSALALVPRYYFHLYNDMDVQDLEGIELPDLPAARAAAIEQARGMIGEMAKTEARIVLSHHIDIEDEDQRVLDTVIFRDIIRIDG